MLSRIFTISLLWFWFSGFPFGSFSFGSLALAQSEQDSAAETPSAQAQPASARPIAIALDWQAPLACPQAQTLSRAISHALNRDVFEEGESELTLEGRLEEVIDPASPYRATLRLITAEGREVGVRVVTLESPDCGQALESLTLILALMVDVSRHEIALRIAARPAVPAPVVEEEAESVTGETALHGTLGLGVGATHGIVPATVPHFSLSAGLRLGSWSGEIWVWATPEGSATLEQDGASLGEGSVHAWAGLGGISLCGLPGQWGTLSLGACVEVGAGFVASRGAGLSRTRSAIRPQGIVGVMARLGLRLSPLFALRLELGARALAARDRLRLSPDGIPIVVFEPWAIVPSATLSIELSL